MINDIEISDPEMMDDIETTLKSGIRPKYKILYDQEKEIKVNSTEDDGRIMIKVYRIQSLRSFGKIKKGALGGYIQSEENLSHEGNCWIYANCYVGMNAQVLDNATVRGAGSYVIDSAKVYDNAVISDVSQVTGNAQVCGNAMVTDRCHIDDNTIICDNAIVKDRTYVGDNVKVQDNALLIGPFLTQDLIIGGNVVIQSDSHYTGKATIIGDITIKKHEPEVLDNLIYSPKITTQKEWDTYFKKMLKNYIPQKNYHGETVLVQKKDRKKK